MAANPSSDSKANLHMQYLRNLHTSFVPPPLTEEQEEEKRGRSRGRAIWLEVLAEQRQFRSQDPDDINDGTHPAFRFLDLPAKLRNMVYMHCLEDTKDMENGNDTHLNRCDLKARDVAAHERAVKWLGSGTTSAYRLYEIDLHKNLSQGNTAYEKYQPADLPDSVRDSCEAYMATYQVEVNNGCEHEKHNAISTVRIKERGNLCEDLPFLALTCRQILDEMWGTVLLNTTSHVYSTDEDDNEDEDEGDEGADDQEHQIYGKGKELRLLTLFQILADVTPLAYGNPGPRTDGRHCVEGRQNSGLSHLLRKVRQGETLDRSSLAREPATLGWLDRHTQGRRPREQVPRRKNSKTSLLGMDISRTPGICFVPY
jgi:hypothetical protein